MPDSVNAASPDQNGDAIALLRTNAINLFVVGFLVMFMELAFIRWFAAYVIFLQFFTNVILLASFLGMSCGCLAARHNQNWLARFPLLALGTITAALTLLAIYQHWAGLAVDVGGQASPQVVFFGTEYRDRDVARFAVPIDLIVAVFFVMVALLFVGLGQILGRAFDTYPDRVRGYTLNIGGSLLGILTFSLLSFIRTPPAVWFFVCCSGVGYLLHQNAQLTRPRWIALAGVVVVVLLPPFFNSANQRVDTYWSPYYAITYDRASRAINVDNIGHQGIVPFSTGGSSYSLIHLLQKSSGGKPFEDELIIGAGSGNDVDHALRFGVKRIDAVEIDPVIQEIGINRNPDRPYQDPRVVRHIDDGRHYLRTTDRKYDLVVYALVDSLILHSGYANIRLESFLFTEQAFRDVKRVLKPGGIFVTYNYFRQGWIVERVAAMAGSVFGCKPIVINLPYQKDLKASERSGYTMIIAGCNSQLAKAFAGGSTFWLNSVPPRNAGVNGFQVQPETRADKADWQRIAPTAIIHDQGKSVSASDDWPFLYLRTRLVPDINLRSMLLLGALGMAMVYWFLPKGQGRVGIDPRMFFLGAAFMLLETRAVVLLALLFGSTWVVNSIVFSTALILILLSNLYVLSRPNVRLVWHYLGLILLLTIGALTPLEVFLGGGLVWRYVVPCALALGPMFFSGVIFARSFRDVANPDAAFGSNIAGAVVGGLCESISMLVGFRYLLVLAMLFYLLSAWTSPLRRAA